MKEKEGRKTYNNYFIIPHFVVHLEYGKEKVETQKGDNDIRR